MIDNTTMIKIPTALAKIFTLVFFSFLICLCLFLIASFKALRFSFGYGIVQPLYLLLFLFSLDEVTANIRKRTRNAIMN